MQIKDYETRNPNRNEEYFNLLNDEQKELYLGLVEKYNNFVLEFLDKEYNLKDVDNSFADSPLGYKEVEKEDCDIYQDMAKNKYKYFYLRSNLYIERLSKEEIEYLKNINEYNDDVNNFLKSTIMKVATETGLDDKTYTTSYGPQTQTYFAQSDEIVIGFRENDLYRFKGTDEEFLKNREDKLFDKAEKLDDLYTDLLCNNRELKFKIIEYNKFSVVPKQRIEELKVL